MSLSYKSIVLYTCITIQSACSNSATNVNHVLDAGELTGHTVTCPSDSGVVSEVPTGTCVGVGSCAIVLQDECGPGIKYISATPNSYICECSSDGWECTLVGGGLGLVPCADAGDGG